MFDARTIGQVIGKEAFEQIHASNLAKIETMTLLHIWAQSSRKKLRDLAQSGQLVPVLKRQYGAGLEQACDLRINSPHLTQTECLQVAELPLTL